MKFKHRSLGVVPLCGAVLTSLGCGASPQAAKAPPASERAPALAFNNPDPSISLTIRPSDTLIPNPSLLGQPGVVQVFDITGTHNHLSLFFSTRAETPQCSNLAEYSAWADSMFKDRKISELDIRSASNPIAAAGLPFIARTYENVKHAGQPAPTAICDAAGLRFETPAGFWTISWNSDLGQIAASRSALDEFLRVLEITRADTAARQAEPSLGIGSAAPPLEVKEWIQGTPVATLDSGRTYVIECWATWCGPCIETIPHLSALAKKHADITFVGVSVLEDNSKRQVQDFVKQMGDKMTYTVGYSGNTDGMAKSWMAAAKQSGIPTAFLVKDRTIMWIGHPIELGPKLENLSAGTFDIAAERAAFERKLAAREAARKRDAKLEECSRLFDAGQRDEAKRVLAEIEQTPQGKAAAEPLRFVWLCIEEPNVWRAKAEEAIARSPESASELSAFAYQNAKRAPEQCRWLISKVTQAFPDDWYPWLCAARVSMTLREYDAALAHAQRSREAILAFQHKNPDAPKGNALDVIHALEEDIKSAKAAK